MGRASAQAPFAPQIPLESEVPIALLVDVTSGQVLYSRNADRRFVPASITKVMSLYLAFELIEAGRLDLRQPITVKEGAAIEWSGKGSSMFLNPDDVVPLADLLTGIATVSANDASIVVAETASGSVPAWIAEMNSKAQSLGMTQSRFGTPNGWPDEGYTFTTANDLVVLAQAMIARHPAKYRRFIGQPDFRYGEIAQSNRDPLLGRVRGADGIKTGYTNEAGFGFLGSAKRDGQRLVLVVAGAGRNAVRARSARGLMEWGFAAFDRQRLFYKDEIVGEARVQNGSSSVVKLVTDRSVAVNVPKGKQSEVRMAVSYNGPIRAPISKGDQVAILEIKVPDMAPARVPLLAAEDVKQAGFFGRVLNAFSGWLN
ncbi:MAG: D-alanyl-D-alanine carboxypeptidase family protein [Pseudomonadota bacterium]|nr:D-alanyl-D-alanine carboxypeptidase family protein [Pseudomonadota bacterium]